jgi:hypothetical protein
MSETQRKNYLNELKYSLIFLNKKKENTTTIERFALETKRLLLLNMRFCFFKFYTIFMYFTLDILFKTISLICSRNFTLITF